MDDDREVDRERLRRHVAELTRAPRPTGSEELRRAREYVTRQLTESGWRVREHAFGAEFFDGGSTVGINLIAEHAQHPLERQPRLCVAAHLDSRPDTPGADDNASAVATLLEIARLLPLNWPDPATLSLELLVTDLEECGMLGGAEHARLTKEQDIDLWGMVSLEMLGYCDHCHGSQKLPRTLVGLYPETGDFIAIIGNQNSNRLLKLFRDGLRKVPGLPVETLSVPENGESLQATRLSDHSPFWDAGYAALMITDTSFMRNPYYHTPGDTLETLDLEFLRRVARGSLEAVRLILRDALHD